MNVMTRRRLLGFACSGLGLLATTLVAPQTANAVAAPTDRFVTIEGAYNVRDLGGLTTPSGRRLKTGVLFRGSSLSRITDTGLSQVTALNLVTVVDSRGTAERANNGEDRLPTGVTLVHAEIPNGSVTPTPDLPAPDPAVIAMFRGFVTDRVAQTGTAAALQQAAAGKGLPMLVHDSSGTYRTGWVAAILLAAVDIDQQQIRDDFLLSNDGLGAVFAFREYIDAGFDQIIRSYGSLRNYLICGLGLEPKQLAALKRNLMR
jgi:protein-tyrosine phosphatase